MRLMKQTPDWKPPEEQQISDSMSPLLLPHRPIDRRTRALLLSFGYAFAGIWYMLRTQRNAQIHCLIGACALGLGVGLGLQRWEWLVLVITITLVLAAEAFNTAIEAVVDIATSTYHPLARIAKDVSAGAVLLCAIMAIIVGCLIFIPHLWPFLIQFWSWF